MSADKILSLIPYNLKSYFYLGVVDGDGCFYYKNNDKNVVRQFSISSTYEQDWSYVEDIFRLLNIKYSIQRTLRKNSKYSQIRITNKIDIYNFGNFIYENINIDNIGLDRKYNKFKLIVS
jgi:hypothetical protein